MRIKTHLDTVLCGLSEHVRTFLDDRGGGDDGDEPAGHREPGRTHAGPPHQSVRRHHRLHLLPAPELLQQPLLVEQPEYLPSHQHLLRSQHGPRHAPGQCSAIKKVEAEVIQSRNEFFYHIIITVLVYISG